MNASRRERELVALFGRDVVEQARSTNVADLGLSVEHIDAIRAAADELLTHAGDPRAQRHVVSGLAADTRLALCLWIMDRDLAAKLAAQALQS